MVEFRNGRKDVGGRWLGTPSDEQQLSCAYTPLPGVHACLRATRADSLRTRVHACPATIITGR